MKSITSLYPLLASLDWSVKTEVQVALISAFATIVSAIVSAYLSGYFEIPKRERPPKHTSTFRKVSKWVFGASLLCFIFAIGFSVGLWRESQLTSTLEKEALAQKHRYIIESAVIWIRISKDTRIEESLSIKVRNVYAILGFQDGAVEFEEIRSMPYSRSERWAASSQNEESLDPNHSRISLNLRRGEITSLATGVNYFGSLSAINGSARPALERPSDITEDYFLYDNPVHFIKSLMIIVESVDVPIEAKGEGAFRITSQRKESSSVEFKTVQGGKLSQKSLVARWQNVRPGQKVGVTYKFKPKTEDHK